MKSRTIRVNKEEIVQLKVIKVLKAIKDIKSINLETVIFCVDFLKFNITEFFEASEKYQLRHQVSIETSIKQILLTFNS